MAVYNSNCLSCHGVMGAGGELGPPLSSGSHPDANTSDAVVFRLIKNGVAGTIMPGWSDKLSDDDIWKIALYIRGIRGNAADAPVAGNVAHGEEIFYGKGQCGNCHMVKGKGGITGPELSNIAAMRKVTTIVDALTKPKHKIYPGGSAHIKVLSAMDNYLPVRVVLKNRKVVSGTLLNENLSSLQILGEDQELHMIDRATVASETYADKSAMPTDYDKRLTPVEFTDLLAYVTRQSVKPPTPGGTPAQAPVTRNTPPAAAAPAAAR
jgi:putative heme-binding domain-containing protein